MSSTRICSSAAFLCLFACASLAAPIVPVSQTRSLAASASHPSGTPSSDMQAAPDFGEFSERASATSGPLGDRVQVFVQQRSMIHEDSIHMVVDGLGLRSLTGGDGDASSIFDVSFDLTVTSEYDLMYNGLASSFTSTGGALSDSTGVLLDFLPVTEQTGILGPGRYRIEIFATGRAADTEDEGRIHQHLDLFFTPVPEPSTASLLVAAFAVLAVARGSARRR